MDGVGEGSQTGASPSFGVQGARTAHRSSHDTETPEKKEKRKKVRAAKFFLDIAAIESLFRRERSDFFERAAARRNAVRYFVVTAYPLKRLRRRHRCDDEDVEKAILRRRASPKKNVSAQIFQPFSGMGVAPFTRYVCRVRAGRVPSDSPVTLPRLLEPHVCPF